MNARYLIPLALLLGATAWGDTAPSMRPLRDVRVVYDMNLPNLPMPVQQILSWNLKRHLLRIDLPAAGVETLVDLRSNQVQLIRNDQRSVMTVPGKTPPEPNSGNDPGLVKGDAAKLAGFDCTDWHTSNGATLCLTADGVLLRAAARGAVLTQAVSVTYGPLPDALFDLPAGYRQITGDTPPNPPPSSTTNDATHN